MARITRFTRLTKPPMKHIALLILLLLPCALFAQYPNNPNKIRLGFQTTGNGLIYRGSGAPTQFPTSYNSPFQQYDTVANVLWVYQDSFWYATNTVRRATPPPYSSTSSGLTLIYGHATWQDSDDEQRYEYVANDSIEAWVPAVGIYYATSAPADIAATPTTGAVEYTAALWNKVPTDSLFRHDGANWVFIGESGPHFVRGDSGALQDIAEGDTLTITGGYGINIVTATGDTVTVIVDTTQVATPYDLTLISTSFVTDADTGTPQTINSGDTLQINSGWGVNTTVGATGLITVTGDSTQVATLYDVSVVQADINTHEAADGDLSATNEIQQIDTFSFSSPTLSISLSSDGVAAKTANLSGLLTGYVTGSGTAGRVPRWTSSSALGDGVLRDDGTLLALGGATVSGYSFYDYSTGGWRLATGTTAQRPTNAAGVHRYNTSLGYSETANGSAWLQSDFPTGATTNTIRHNGTNWIASSNLINDGTVVRAAGATNRIHLFPSDFTDGQLFNGQISLLNNAESAAAKFAVGGSQLWLRVIGGLQGTGRGVLISPNGEAVLTATNTLLTLNTTAAATLQSWLLNGTQVANLTTGTNTVTFSLNTPTAATLQSWLLNGTQVASLSAETGANAHLLLRSNVTTANRGISNYHHQNGVAGAYMGFLRSRGTASAQTALQNGDIIGASVFRPYDGANYTVDNCYFGGNISGAVSTGNTPSSLFFIAGPTTSYLPDLLIHSGGNVGIGSSGTGDITSAVNTPPRQLTIYGEARITDLTTDTPTRIVGADADGDLGAVSEGYGVNITGGALEVDTTQIATQSDLAAISPTTLYTGDGTIATDRTVTIDDNYALITSGSPGVLSFTGTSGYVSSLSAYGYAYEIADTAFYITNATVKQPGIGSTIWYIQAGRQDATASALAEVNGDGGVTLGSIKTAGESSLVLDGQSITHTADLSHIVKIGATTIHTTTSTGVGINDTSPEKSLDVGGMGKFRQLSGQDNSVTIGTNANMGTGRSASVTGSQSSDVAGRFSFTSGTGLTAGEWVTLTWGTAFDNPPAVVLMPEDANGASITPYLFVQPTTTGCSIQVNVTGAPYEGLTYSFNYIVIQGK